VLIGRVLIVAKSAYYFRHVRPFLCLSVCLSFLFLSVCLSFLCLSVCPKISARFPLDGCREILYWGLVWKSDKKTQIWFKSVKNIVHFTWRPELVLLLSTKLNRHKSALFDRNCIRMFVRPSFYLFFSPHISTRIPPHRFTSNFILRTFMKFCWGFLPHLPYFSIDNAHPKLFRHSFWCIDNAHGAN
jgi:hypothetical protein